MGWPAYRGLRAGEQLAGSSSVTPVQSTLTSSEIRQRITLANRQSVKVWLLCRSVEASDVTVGRSNRVGNICVAQHDQSAGVGVESQERNSCWTHSVGAERAEMRRIEFQWRDNTLSVSEDTCQASPH